MKKVLDAEYAVTINENEYRKVTILKRYNIKVESIQGPNRYGDVSYRLIGAEQDIKEALRSADLLSYIKVKDANTLKF